MLQRTGVLPTTISTSNILQMKYIFGLNGQMRNSLHFVNDDEFIYQAGNNIVEYNIIDKVQD